MRAPDWWGPRRGGGLAWALAPLGWAWGAAGRARFAATRPWRAPVPVLCVGNLVAGGAGKTPVALSLGARLAAGGVNAHFLTRGYGGGNRGPVRVDPRRQRFDEVGDEALLLAAVAPTWVARERAAGARAAAAAGAAAIVMDDGFQNPSLHKDVSVVVVDGGYGFGNGRLIPGGPLRESLACGLGRADGVVLVGADASGVRDAIAGAAAKAPPILAARVRAGAEAERLRGRSVVAFCGIGRPAKFFATLAQVGCRLAAVHAFADHHPYTAGDLERLAREAAAKAAVLVTTAKDWVRLPPPARPGIEVLTITLEWEDEAALDRLLWPLSSSG